MIHKLPLKRVLKLIRFWPPFLGAGIKIISVNEELTKIKVKMNLTSLNRNYVGVHFGGSLYSMCDPFFMILLIHHLGKEHVVWDKSASIDFKKPGKGSVTAEFEITQNQLSEFKDQALQQFSIRPVFNVSVYNESGEEIASVQKEIYIRRKDAKERFSR